jgi:shikimate kinase
LATLFIIAGPNGAGKSTNSAVILRPYQIVAFDYDKELEAEWRRFSFDLIVEEGVRNAVGEMFLEQKILQFATRRILHLKLITITNQYLRQQGNSKRLGIKLF